MKSKSSSNSQSRSLTSFLHYDMSVHPLEHLSCKVEEMDTDELKRSMCTWERIAAIFGQSAYPVGPFLSLYREYNSLYDAHHCPRFMNCSVLSSLRDSFRSEYGIKMISNPSNTAVPDWFHNISAENKQSTENNVWPAVMLFTVFHWWTWRKHVDKLCSA